ncbi:hypothetical protein CR51_03210 [Caballeronia megalochromosomata]|nr:hypothetical protein CR51_03210 [Caballeronia megalochromosomata]
MLLAKITPCFENGKIAEARVRSEFAFGSTEFHVLRPQPQKLDARYLVNFLRREKVLIEGERKMTGSAGQRRVPKHFLESLQIPLPDLAEQRRIAAILDKANALRAKRQLALTHFEILANSIFMEMFGDPSTNLRKHQVVQLDELCVRITDGTHQSPKWEEEGIPFLFISNIVDGIIRYETDKYISKATYQELTRRCPIEVGDVLYTTVGSYGNTAVVTHDREFCFQRHIAHIKPDRRKLDSIFCAYMLRSSGVRRQVDRAARGVAQKTVNLHDLKTLRVFEPSLQSQLMFSDRIKTVARLKEMQVRALVAADGFFTSLQHRAFTGNL